MLSSSGGTRIRVRTTPLIGVLTQFRLGDNVKSYFQLHNVSHPISERRILNFSFPVTYESDGAGLGWRVGSYRSVIQLRYTLLKLIPGHWYLHKYMSTLISDQ